MRTEEKQNLANYSVTMNRGTILEINKKIVANIQIDQQKKNEKLKIIPIPMGSALATDVEDRS